MNTKTSAPLSKYIIILLYLTIGYSPWIPLWRHADDMEWLGEFMNESLAWSIILSGFDILVIISAFRIFSLAPIFSIASICFAVYPLAWNWYSLFEDGLGPSSKADQNPYAEMIIFWLFGGGGEVILFGILPLTALYFYVLFKERRAATRSFAPT